MCGWLVGWSVLVCAFMCAFVSAFVCSFRGLFACFLSWVEIYLYTMSVTLFSSALLLRDAESGSSIISSGLSHHYAGLCQQGTATVTRSGWG